MGGCISHMKKEMAPIPQRRSHGQGLSPERPLSKFSQDEVRKVRTTNHGTYNNTNGQPLRRFETPSGIPGLTYDQAGRPVWREENASKPDFEHHENRW